MSGFNLPPLHPPPLFRSAVSIPHGGFFVGKYTDGYCIALGRCLNPPRGIFCWEGWSWSLADPTSSLNPPRGIFCWEEMEIKELERQLADVSIPHGGFFVGKTRGWVSATRVMISLNPPRGIFCWEVSLHRQPCPTCDMSQSPTGDFLLGRNSLMTSSVTGSTVSIPHGGFFVGKA